MDNYIDSQINSFPQLVEEFEQLRSLCNKK
jgi:hypothetical protein